MKLLLVSKHRATSGSPNALQRIQRPERIYKFLHKFHSCISRFLKESLWCWFDGFDNFTSILFIDVYWASNIGKCWYLYWKFLQIIIVCLLLSLMEDRRFESHSSRHVGTFGLSLTVVACSASAWIGAIHLWRPHRGGMGRPPSRRISRWPGKMRLSRGKDCRQPGRKKCG